MMNKEETVVVACVAIPQQIVPIHVLSANDNTAQI